MRAVVLLAVCFFAAPWVSAAEQAHAIRQGTQSLAFHYGLAFALIVASLVIGSALLLSAPAGPHWEELPLLGIAEFAVAGVLGIAWAVLALKSGKL